MSKALLVCSRSWESGGVVIDGADFQRRLLLLEGRLNPDNIVPRAARILCREGLCIAVFNPSESMAITDSSVCVGNMLTQPADWFMPGAAVPDGSFAIYRSNKEFVELVTDVVGSRTIWYALTDATFIASSSQRAIVAFLGTFHRNDTAIAWMLSSGTLGPEGAWDARIRRLDGDSRLVLNRKSWTINISGSRPRFVPLAVTQNEHRGRLMTALEETFSRLDLDYRKWVCALSGGYDSRAILMFLKDRAGIRYITWGLKESATTPGSDAYVARALAEEFGVHHRFFETDLSDEPVGGTLERFLVAGEGRIDFVSGYTDGFKLWKTLFEENVDGVIRGDQGFSSKPVGNSLDVLQRIGLTRFSDFRNLPRGIIENLPEQVLPETLCRMEGESLPGWRDRLYQEFRIPAILAAMTDLKSAYVEVANPLLSRPIIECVRSLPDDLRTNKRLFRQIVGSLNTQTEFGNHKATDLVANVFRSGRVNAYIRNELESADADRLVTTDLADFVRESLVAVDGRARTRASLSARKRLIPKRLRHAAHWVLKRNQNILISRSRLAFRVFIVMKMCRMLERDAAVLAGVAPDAGRRHHA